MRRIRDNGEAETIPNVYEAYENYSKQKHHRSDIVDYDAQLGSNLRIVLQQLIDESWQPHGYLQKTIHGKKDRVISKAPIQDHVIEAAAVLPYEKRLYDYIAYQSPAVRPHMGTHAFFRRLRNDLYRYSQKEMMYNISMDIHHYFPLMDHQLMKDAICYVVKPGKLRRLLFKVVDSHRQGAPLGIKLAQIFGQIYLARFDRLVLRFFDIGRDSEKMAYWTSRYITMKLMTAKTVDDYKEISHGTIYLAEQFHRYVNERPLHYYRFVDNIIFVHRDKTVVQIVKELAIMTLTRDYHAQLNSDYNVRPTWMGIRILGYQFFHDHVLVGRSNKQKLAERVKILMKRGLTQEQIRIRESSRLGYAKHANITNFIKSIGMEETLGDLIRNKRIRAPFAGMKADQKVPFQSICKMIGEKNGCWDKKIMLLDYIIEDSKVEKQSVLVPEVDDDGETINVMKTIPAKMLAIRFKKIIGHTKSGKCLFEKLKDHTGKNTLIDAEYYSFTGSKILINQASRDFSREDLPCPTIIEQFPSKLGQTFFKFT